MLGALSFFVVFLFVAVPLSEADDDADKNGLSYAKRMDATTENRLSVATKDGSSLRGQTVNGVLSNIHYRVATAWEVENFTKWPMTNPQGSLESGKFVRNPRTVQPGYRETLATRNTGSIFHRTGSWGSVSWKIGNERVIVMWSAPYSFTKYSNTLAVGITTQPHTSSLTKDMYYKSGNFIKREFFYNVERIHYCSHLFCVQGSMGKGHKTTIKISVYPKDYANLAKSIKSQITATSYNIN